MSIDVDEDEHSIEMHLPYVRKIFKDISIVPILVGAISSEKEQEYGEVLAPYLQAQENTFVVSSDFAHWCVAFPLRNLMRLMLGIGARVFAIRFTKSRQRRRLIYRLGRRPACRRPHTLFTSPSKRWIEEAWSLSLKVRTQNTHATSGRHETLFAAGIRSALLCVRLRPHVSRNEPTAFLHGIITRSRRALRTRATPASATPAAYRQPSEIIWKGGTHWRRQAGRGKQCA